MTRAQFQKRLSKFGSLISKFCEELEQFQTEAQDAFDGKSENWQEGDSGQEWQEWVENIDSILNSAQDTQGELQGMIE